MAGDLNGDGYTDVCIGAHAWDNDEEMGDLGNKAGKFWCSTAALQVCQQFLLWNVWPM